MVREASSGAGTSSSQTYLETLDLRVEDLDDLTAEEFRQRVENRINGDTVEEVTEQSGNVLTDLNDAQQRLERMKQEIERALRRNRGSSATGQELIAKLDELIAECEAAERVVREVREDFVPATIDIQKDDTFTPDDSLFSATEPREVTLNVSAKISTDPFGDSVDPDQSETEYFRDKNYTDAAGNFTSDLTGDGIVTGADIERAREEREQAIRSQRYTVTLNLPPDSHLSLVPGSNPPKFKIEKAGGTACYVTINGDCNIVIVNGLTSADKDILPAWGFDLLKRTYVNGRPLHDSIYGDPDDLSASAEKALTHDPSLKKEVNHPADANVLGLLEGYEAGRAAWDELTTSRYGVYPPFTEDEFLRMWERIFRAVSEGEDFADVWTDILAPYNAAEKKGVIIFFVAACAKYAPEYFDMICGSQINYLEGILVNATSGEPDRVTKLAYLLLETRSTIPGMFGGAAILTTRFHTDPEIEPTADQWANTEDNIWALQKLAELNPAIAGQASQVRQAQEELNDDDGTAEVEAAEPALTGAQYAAIATDAYHYYHDYDDSDIDEGYFRGLFISFFAQLNATTFESFDDMRIWIVTKIIEFTAVYDNYQDNLAVAIVLAFRDCAGPLFDKLRDTSTSQGSDFVAQLSALINNGGEEAYGWQEAMSALNPSDFFGQG